MPLTSGERDEIRRMELNLCDRPTCATCIETRRVIERIQQTARERDRIPTLTPWIAYDANEQEAESDSDNDNDVEICFLCMREIESCTCWTCEYCCDRYRENRGEQCADCGRCGDCCGCGRRATGRIFDYSEKAESRFGFFPDRETLPDRGRKFLYLGIELECERKTNCDENLDATVIELDRCEQYQNWALCKHDGSLDCGFEVVSAPSELAEHKKRWPSILKIVRKNMSAWRRPSTGLHVHLSRSWFSSLDLAKFIYFINAEENRHYIVALAGRTSPDYGRLKKKKLALDMLYNDNRYEAVNLSNYRTIEVRMFKGTLNTQHVLANLEFCHALAHYVKVASIQDCTWEAFWSYVVKAEKTYKHLVDYMRVAESKLKTWIASNALESFFEYTEEARQPQQFRELDTERELSQIVPPVYQTKKGARLCA